MRWIVCLAVLAGCYGPTAKVGVPCSSDGACPSGQHCNMRLEPPTCEAGDARPIDAPPDAPPTCVDNTDCSATTPICDPLTSFCRGCAADTECGAPGVCIELEGTCHNASNALFIAPAGAGSSCSRADPCTLATAMNQVANNQRVVVVLDGTYTNQFSIPSSYDANSLTLSGEDSDPAGAVVTPATGQALFVAVNATPLVVEGITFRGAASSSGVDNRGALTLSRVLVENSGLIGITSSTTFALAVVDSIIRNNMGNGLDITAGAFEMRRSQVVGNLTGGLDIRTASFVVENTIIATNGSSTSTFGGVRISNVDGQSPQTFSFSTFAANAAMVAEKGMICPATVVVDSSIVLDGVGPCVPEFSLTSPTDPMFVSTTDFHLGPTSPAIDAANPDATIVDDIDRQNRPVGAARDIGADEVAP